jgi:hypothetical protein
VQLLGTQTGKILAGAKAGELPVELPTRIEMRINLKVALERRITIPAVLLARADTVIESPSLPLSRTAAARDVLGPASRPMLPSSDPAIEPGFTLAPAFINS